MARIKDIYKPSRRKNGEGVGKFCTVNLKEDIATEFKHLVQAYSDIYGQKMTPTQVIKRLMDAGVKRCDPDVYAAFLRQRDEGTPKPVVEITPPVDPTEGEVWEMRYFFEKEGEEIEAKMNSKGDSFSAKIGNRFYSLDELLRKGWKFMNDGGVEISEEEAKVIALTIFKRNKVTFFDALNKVMDEADDYPDLDSGLNLDRK